MVGLLPTLQIVLLMGGLVKIYVNQYSSIKPIALPQTTSTNATVFLRLKNPDGTNYVVPAATNLRIWGIENLTMNLGGASATTVLQFGYADDAIGTNFVPLYDFLLPFPDGTNWNVNNVLTSLLTCPANKFPLLKYTAAGVNDTYKFNFLGYETG